MDPRPDPTLPPDDAARAQARDLLAAARHAALAVTDARSGTPGISRIAFGLDPGGVPLALVSALAPHRAALAARPDCAFMVGEPGERGDPLTHPRLMVQARAAFADPAERPALRARWLAQHPKAAVYADLPDFAFVRLHPVGATLNGGFARAYRLAPHDLGLADPPDSPPK